MSSQFNGHLINSVENRPPTSIERAPDPRRADEQRSLARNLARDRTLAGRLATDGLGNPSLVGRFVLGPDEITGEHEAKVPLEGKPQSDLVTSYSVGVGCRVCLLTGQFVDQFVVVGGEDHVVDFDWSVVAVVGDSGDEQDWCAFAELKRG